jgi:Fe-S cluster assembly protein SufD
MTGGRTARETLSVEVNGPGAHSDVASLYAPGTGQCHDSHTLIDHRAPNCTADQLYKGILHGAGHGIFNGKIYVQQIAQQTNANQLNQNLMLSKSARIDTKPQLEIFADDVRCTHGATVGQIEPEELFYMMSRAIPEDAARRMIIAGFAEDALERVSHVPAAQHMRDLLDAHLD